MTQTKQEIINEAMSDVRRIVHEKRCSVSEQLRKDKEKYNSAVAKHEEEIKNDPPQIEWERTQGINRKPKQKADRYALIIPDGAKAIFYIILLIACVVFLGGYSVGAW